MNILRREVLVRVRGQLGVTITPEELLSKVVTEHVTPQKVFAELERENPATVLNRYLLQGGNAEVLNTERKTLWEVIFDNLRPDCLPVLGNHVGAASMSNWRNADGLTPLMVLARECLPSATKGDPDLLMAEYLLYELKVDQRPRSGRRHGRMTACGMAENPLLKKMLFKARGNGRRKPK